MDSLDISRDCLSRSEKRGAIEGGGGDGDEGAGAGLLTAVNWAMVGMDGGCCEMWMKG